MLKLLPHASLDPLFCPRAVAIIGASNDPNKIGGRPLAFLKRGGFAGTIYPINPSAGEIQGLRAYADLAAVPGEVDAAIIALGAEAVPGLIDAAIAKGAKALIVFSAGFAEIGRKGQQLQDTVAAKAGAGGVRVLGPNSLGVFSPRSGFFGTFSTALDHAWPRAGRVAMVSQSGAVGSYVYAMAQAQGVGFSHFVATGNECDVDVADAIAWLARDDDTAVIAGYFEGCRDGGRLIAALETARARRKPVVLMKAGASEAGAEAAASHTGSLAGSDQVYDAVFAAHNVYRAHSVEELVDVAYAAAGGRWPARGRVGVITPSGGVGIVLADAAAAYGIELPEMPQAAQDKVRALVPFAGPRNPVDTTAQILNDFSIFSRTLDIMVEDVGYDVLIAFLAHIGRNPAHMGKLKEALIEVRARNPQSLFALCLLTDPALREELNNSGFLVFEDPGRTVRALAALRGFAQGFDTKLANPNAGTAMPHIGREQRNETQSKQLLAAAGIPVIPERLVRSREAAVQAAAEIGFPVVMKIVSADIAHKTEVGGVALDLRSPAEVGATYNTMLTHVTQSMPSARIDGVLIAPMISGGVDTILGVQHDPVFGPVVMFGLGGIFVEVFRDVAFRVAPFGEDAALAMIKSIRGYPLLDGARGRAKCDVAALARAISKLSQFAHANAGAFAAIDINPLVALPDAAFALDALIIPTSQPEEDPAHVRHA
jgi:acetate---CoA ligase (ADP-forming)